MLTTKTNNLTAISIFCLAVSIVIGSWLISESLSPRPQVPQTAVSGQLLNKDQLAKYLGVTPAQASQLGPITQVNGGTTSILPFIQIGSKVYFPKASVNKWLSSR